jgi:hypothetical protein
MQKYKGKYRTLTCLICAQIELTEHRLELTENQCFQNNTFNKFVEVELTYTSFQLVHLDLTHFTTSFHYHIMNDNDRFGSQWLRGGKLRGRKRNRASSQTVTFVPSNTNELSPEKKRKAYPTRMRVIRMAPIQTNHL